MWVVVEWNQASHQPDLPTGSTIHTSRDDAEEDAETLRAITAQSGRRERYTVHQLSEEDNDE